METELFEHALSDFLDGEDYDQAEEWLFQIIRGAFLAGWKSALQSQIHILPKDAESQPQHRKQI